MFFIQFYFMLLFYGLNVITKNFDVIRKENEP